MHNDGFHIVDSVIAADTTVVNCSSSSFFVVPEGVINRKLRKVFAASFTKALGSVEVQVRLLRNGAESSLLSAPFTYNTASFYGSTSNVLDVALAVGDIIFIKVLNVSGTAKGLSVTMDIR